MNLTVWIPALTAILAAIFSLALLDGSSFGRHGADHLRISYASSLENLEHAVERIGAFTAGL